MTRSKMTRSSHPDVACQPIDRPPQLIGYA
jgi:hypothetical protein